MTVCVIKVWRNYKGRKKATKKVTYHRIPNDPVLRSRWIDIIRKSRGEEVWKPSKYSLVCSEHFRKKDKYFANNQGRLRLKTGTLPCKALFLSSMQSDDSDVSDEENNLKETEPITNVEARPTGHIKAAHLSSVKREVVENCEDEKNTTNETEPTTDVEAGSFSILKAEHLSSIELDDTTNFQYVTCHIEDAKNISNKAEPITNVEARPTGHIKAAHLSSVKREVVENCEDEKNTTNETEPTTDVEAGSFSILKAEHLSSIELDDTTDFQYVTCHIEDAKNISNKAQNETDAEAAALQEFSDDSIFDSPKEVKLKKDLRRKNTLQKKHILKIQSLRRKNIRLKKKILTLKEIIVNLKKRGI